MLKKAKSIDFGPDWIAYIIGRGPEYYCTISVSWQERSETTKKVDAGGTSVG